MHPPSRPIPGLAQLRLEDRGFSTPVLLDYVVLVYRRAYEAVGNREWGAILPFVAPSAQQSLMAHHRKIARISEVVVGGVSVTKVERREDYDYLYVQFECSRMETFEEGQSQRVQITEQWTFRRAAGATSPNPEGVMRLGCPSCGAAIEVTTMGTCHHCNTPITAGQLTWQATYASTLQRTLARVPQVSWSAGGNESSVLVPIVQDPNLPEEMKALGMRHPEFDVSAFRDRVDLVYHELQAAWSAGEWSRARPFLTDRMYQTLPLLGGALCTSSPPQPPRGCGARASSHRQSGGRCLVRGHHRAPVGVDEGQHRRYKQRSRGWQSGCHASLLRVLDLPPRGWRGSKHPGVGAGMPQLWCATRSNQPDRGLWLLRLQDHHRPIRLGTRSH